MTTNTISSLSSQISSIVSQNSPHENKFPIPSSVLARLGEEMDKSSLNQIDIPLGPNESLLIKTVPPKIADVVQRLLHINLATYTPSNTVSSDSELNMCLLSETGKNIQKQLTTIIEASLLPHKNNVNLYEVITFDAYLKLNVFLQNPDLHAKPIIEEICGLFLRYGISMKARDSEPLGSHYINRETFQSCIEALKEILKKIASKVPSEKDKLEKALKAFDHDLDLLEKLMGTPFRKYAFINLELISNFISFTSNPQYQALSCPILIKYVDFILGAINQCKDNISLPEELMLRFSHLKNILEKIRIKKSECSPELIREISTFIADFNGNNLRYFFSSDPTLRPFLIDIERVSQLCMLEMFEFLKTHNSTHLVLTSYAAYNPLIEQDISFPFDIPLHYKNFLKSAQSIQQLFAHFEPLSKIIDPLAHTIKDTDIQRQLRDSMTTIQIIVMSSFSKIRMWITSNEIAVSNDQNLMNINGTIRFIVLNSQAILVMGKNAQKLSKRLHNLYTKHGEKLLHDLPEMEERTFKSIAKKIIYRYRDLYTFHNLILGELSKYALCGSKLYECYIQKPLAGLTTKILSDASSSSTSIESDETASTSSCATSEESNLNSHVQTSNTSTSSTSSSQENKGSKISSSAKKLNNISNIQTSASSPSPSKKESKKMTTSHTSSGTSSVAKPKSGFNRKEYIKNLLKHGWLEVPGHDGSHNGYQGPGMRRPVTIASGGYRREFGPGTAGRFAREAESAGYTFDNE